MASITELLVVPTSVFQSGNSYGPWVTPQVGDTYSGFAVSVTKMGSWADGPVCTVSIEISSDGGVTWSPKTSSTVAGGTWLDVDSNTVTSGIIAGATLGSVAGEALLSAPTDLYQVSLQALQSFSGLFTLTMYP